MILLKNTKENKNNQLHIQHSAHFVLLSFLPWAVALQNLFRVIVLKVSFQLHGCRQWSTNSLASRIKLSSQNPPDSMKKNLKPSKSQCCLNSKLIPDDLSTLHLHLLVKPLPVTAAFDSTLARVALGAGIEAAHTVHVQTVTHVIAVGEQSTFVVVHSALGSHVLPAGWRGQDWCQRWSCWLWERVTTAEYKPPSHPPSSASTTLWQWQLT